MAQAQLGCQHPRQRGPGTDRVVNEVELGPCGIGLFEHLPERQGVRDEAVGVRTAGPDDEDLVPLRLELGLAARAWCR